MDTSHFNDYMQPVLRMLKERSITGKRSAGPFEVLPCGYLDMKRIADEDGWLPGDEETPFGGHDAHWICRTTVTVPDDLTGAHGVCLVETGLTDIWNYSNPQFIAYIDGRMTCGLDVNHTEFNLPSGKKSFSLALYGYCSTDKKDVFLRISLARRDDAVTALHRELSVLCDSIGVLDPADPWRMRLVRMCISASCLLDSRDLTSEAFSTSVLRALSFLKDELEAIRAMASPVTINATGHAHIDVAWLWTLDQTREKVLRTFSTVDYLMDIYPQYIFSGSQPVLYDFVKKVSPDLFSRIQARVAEDRWEIEGGMWLESDCNLTSGESLVRQLLHGTRFISGQFKKTSHILWLPDTFGFTGNLPQIMKHCGMSYFMTTKLGWNSSDIMPHDTFRWVGIDGSSVLAHMVTTRDHAAPLELLTENQKPTTYNGLLTPSQVAGTWQRYRDKELSSTLLHCYGYGDGGGGPTKEMLEQGGLLSRGIPGVPRVRFSTALDFFKTLEKELSGKKVPTWHGELYLQYHQGTFTTMADIKKNNRTSERMIMAAELLSSSAWVLERKSYPDRKLDEAWRLILLNQFHDILPGSSIHEVYEESRAQYGRIGSMTQDIMETALGQLASASDCRMGDIMVFNTTGIPRDEVVSLPCDGPRSITGPSGPVPSTWSGGILSFLAGALPSKGYSIYRVDKKDGMTGKNSLPASDSPFIIEGLRITTPWHVIEFDPDGCISSLVDRKHERDIVPSGSRMNLLRLYEDRPREYDAWNIGPQGESHYWDVLEPCTLSVVSHDRYTARLRLERRFGSSHICQDILLHAATDRIDFLTTIDWHEEHLMLRVLFPVALCSTTATYDIAFGTIERPTHANTSWDQARQEVPAHIWADVSEAGFGVTLLSDSTYGYSVVDGTMALSLLRSPHYPNPQADKGKHSFTYAIRTHDGTYREGGVVEAGLRFQNPVIVHSCTQDGRGILPGSFSLLAVDRPGIVIGAVKKAEDRHSLIVRIHEAHGKMVRTSLDIGIPVSHVWETDGLENRKRQVPVDDKTYKADLSFRPFELKTLELEIPRDNTLIRLK